MTNKQKAKYGVKRQHGTSVPRMHKMSKLRYGGSIRFVFFFVGFRIVSTLSPRRILFVIILKTFMAHKSSGV